MRRGGDAGVAFCRPGVGAVLSILWFSRVFSRSLDPKDRSAPAPLRRIRFREVAARAVHPSVSAAMSPESADDACLRAAVAARSSKLVRLCNLCRSAKIDPIKLCNLADLHIFLIYTLPLSILAA